MDGIILIDKPKDFTSFDAVNFLKKRFNFKKAGHAGTLDPLATGLLIILIGKATKLAGTFLNDSKVYLTTAKLGIKTDTFDITGKVIRETASMPDPEKIRQVLKNFQGKVSQTPPVFSALKHKGQRLYKLARRGKAVIPQKRTVFIHYIKNLKLSAPQLRDGGVTGTKQDSMEVFFEVKCSKGTYIRSLCNDMGEILGCGAALGELRRIKSGKFNIEDAVSIDGLKNITKEKIIEKFLLKI